MSQASLLRQNLAQAFLTQPYLFLGGTENTCEGPSLKCRCMRGRSLRASMSHMPGRQNATRRAHICLPLRAPDDASLGVSRQRHAMGLLAHIQKPIACLAFYVYPRWPIPGALGLRTSESMASATAPEPRESASFDARQPGAFLPAHYAPGMPQCLPGPSCDSKTLSHAACSQPSLCSRVDNVVAQQVRLAHTWLAICRHSDSLRPAARAGHPLSCTESALALRGAGTQVGGRQRAKEALGGDHSNKAVVSHDVTRQRG